MAGTLGEQDASKAVSNPARERQERTPVQLEGFLLGATASKKFGFAHHGLNRQSARPPSKKRSRHQVMTSADNEFLGMVEKNSERVHEAVGVPTATHGSGAVDLERGR